MCVYHDPVMTLTDFMARSTYRSHVQQTVKILLNTVKGKKPLSQEKGQMDRILMNLKREIDPRG